MVPGNKSGLLSVVTRCCLAAALAGLAAACATAPTPAPTVPAATPTIPPVPLPAITKTPALPTATPTDPACGSPNWSLDFTRSGGFAGKTLSLHLSSSGPLSATDPVKNLTVPIALSGTELDRMAGLLWAACPFKTQSMPATCPDCFSYTLEISMEGETYSAHATDVELAGLGALIQALNTLLTQSFSGRP
jgi:hypothetical protein